MLKWKEISQTAYFWTQIQLDHPVPTRRICTEQESMNVSHWITWNRSTNQRRDCLSPCNFLLINVGSKNSRVADNATLGYHQLFFAPR